LSIQDIRTPSYRKKELEYQIPTLAFFDKFNKLMVGIFKQESLKN